MRKEARILGKSVLLFWYRNQIYAIEARCARLATLAHTLPRPPLTLPPHPTPTLCRSPAEGAYSEGFIRSKFTQDFCIECPTTGSLFSLKDGSIVSWYPSNPVLRALTPQSTCRNLEIYPVRLTQDAISVDVSGMTRAAGGTITKGGSDTSLENNNVYGLEPKVYVEGEAQGSDGANTVAQVASAGVGILALAAVAVVSAAVVKYVLQ